MKDKITSEKASGPQETTPDVADELKKEPGLSSAICDADGAGKNGEPNLNVVKGQERGFLDPKTEIGQRPEDIKQEDDLLSLKIKTENISDGNVLFPSDGNENLMLGVGQVNEAPGGPPGGPPTGPQCTGSGVQPLPSNVINKQPGTMEAQYMQQQSQIFVFSTSLANKAADTVFNGQYPSIIAYHCAQPGTKKYLEKHPLKHNQFNRQSPAQWLNNLAQFKQKGFGGPTGSPGGGPPPHMAPKGGRGMPDMVGGHSGGPGGPGPRMMGPGGPMHDLDTLPDGPDLGPNREMHPDFPPIHVWNQPGVMNHNNLGCGGPMRPMDREKAHMGNRPAPMGDPYPGMSQYTLTGTKVPTENLTPQQRQHREEQLATLRKMQQMLFPENQTQPQDDFANPRIMIPHNPQDGAPNGNLNGPHPGRSLRNNMEGPMESPMMNPNPGMVGSPLVNPGNNMGMGTGEGGDPMNHDSTMPMQKMAGGHTVAAQMEWHKLQQQFYEERKKKGPRTSPAPRGPGGPGGSGCMKMPPGMGGMPSMPGNMPPLQGNMSPMHGNMPPMQGNMSSMQGTMPPMQGNMSSIQGNMPPMQGNMPSMQGNMPHMQGNMPPMQGNMPPMQGNMPPMQGNMPPMHGNMPPMQGGISSQMHSGIGPLQGNVPPMQSNMLPQMQGGMPQMQGMQGPPPPYHQTARCASVPIGGTGPSPAPESPSNTTSNLSLPSPRTCSDLNSPADVNKMVKLNTCSPPTNQGSPACSKMPPSNPGTPVSASQSPTPNKDMYSRGQKVGKPAGSGGNKEPNLMPVPSPQQIQYLNTFEGQELTIQKQPNTSLKDTNSSSPLNHQSLPETPKCKTPNTSNNSPNQQQGSPRYQQMQQQPPQQSMQHSAPQTAHNAPANKGDGSGVASSPDHGRTDPSPCRQPADNIPLNPNGVTCPPSSKAMHFDPITSLAQMSQQLTSQAPPCQGPSFPQNNMMSMDQGMHIDSMDNLPFVSQQGPPMMEMPPNYINNPSPKPGMGTPPVRCVGPPFFGGPQFPRMMGPGPGPGPGPGVGPYNGMNVQVKASTPNTIQYLPARPTGNSPIPGARNPPSLDFLQRFTNPGPEVKPPMFMGNCHPGPMENPNPNMMMGGTMLRGPIRPGMKPGPPNMGKPSGPPVFDPMSMNPQGLFKGSLLGMPPDASQPLPPSMSQGNNFKNSPFVGPTTNDPNYAQQFHNFQQQLYATNTRSQLNSHLNQSYFMPK